MRCRRWNSIRLFAEHKESWFRKHLTLPGGIPAAITFNRIFAALELEEFRCIFIQWIKDVLSGLELSDSRIVALDGKTVKGSAWNKGKDAIHMLNAWCTDAGLSLGQYKVDAKSNEITAIPELLKLLELSGCLVTHDIKEGSKASAWGAKTIAAIQLDSCQKSKVNTLIRYFISSRQLCAEEVLQATRQHWLVENQLHWVLDVAFDEDRCRAREGYAAEKLAVTRQVTLNLLKLDTSVKAGIKNKRKTCGWDENYMMKVLGLINS